MGVFKQFREPGRWKFPLLPFLPDSWEVDVTCCAWRRSVSGGALAKCPLRSSHDGYDHGSRTMGTWPPAIICSGFVTAVKALPAILTMAHFRIASA